MIQRRAAVVVILASLIIGLSITGCNPFSSAEPVPTAAVRAAADTKPEVEVISAEGVVVPDKQADLSFKIPGRVEEILVSEGDVVEAGAELARLETKDLEQPVLRARASLKSAQAELAKVEAGSRPEEIAAAEAVLVIAQAGVQTAEDAVAVGEGSLAAALAEVQTADQAVRVAQGNLSAAQAGLSSARASLEKLQAGATTRDIRIAEKEVELSGAEVWTWQRFRDEGAPGMEGEIAVAETMLEISDLQLAQLKDPPRAEDVAIARAQVSQALADVQTMRAQLAQARTRVDQAEAGVQTAEAQLAQTHAEAERAGARAMQAQAELDLVKAGSREEDIAVAEAAVGQAAADLVEAENAIDDTVLRAPFDGTVGAILAGEGELVSAQRPVFRLGDLSQLRVETEDLSEVDISQVRVGQAALVSVDALGGEEFEALVSEVAPVAKDHRGDTVYTVAMDLGVGPESGLRWGMSTFVEIDVEELPSDVASKPAVSPSPVPSLTPTPTATPSPTPTPTRVPATLVPTSTPAPTMTPMPTRAVAAAVTPLATSRPRPTAVPATPTRTPPPPNPEKYAAPALESPRNGEGFSEYDTVTLSWRPVGQLGQNEYYVPRVTYNHSGETWVDETPWTKETRWNLSEHPYLLVLSDRGEFEWSVRVMQRTGTDANGLPVGSPASPQSEVRRLLWKTAAPGGGGRATPDLPEP